MTQGIFGIVDFSGKIPDPAQRIMTMGSFGDRDGKGRNRLSFVWNAHYLLGMRRISHDPENQQTMVWESGSHEAISMIHGEINNYLDLYAAYAEIGERAIGDLDLIIRIYRREGLQFIRKLNGLFSLAVLDLKDHFFFLANDRFGMAHQIHWTVLGNRFYFATHLKTLLACPEISREVDTEGLNLFLKYSYIPSPWTIFKKIEKLPPGHLLTYKNGTVSVKRCWEFSIPAGDNGYFQDAIVKYKILLKESISRRLNRNGKTGILLSGGLDSSANVALAAECTGHRLRTFSVGFDDPAFDERPYARIVSEHFKTEHYETVVTGDEVEDLPKLIWHLEEPYFEFGLFLTYKGLEAAGKEVDVVLGGEGADQLFGTGGFAKGRPAALHYLLSKYHLLGLARRTGGFLKNPYFYNQDNLAFKLRLLWQRSIDLNNWFFYGFDQHELLHLYKDPKLAVIPQIFPDQSDTQYPTPKTRNLSFDGFFLQTQISQDLKHYVNENVMVKSGRMADMLGLTLRESYLDNEVTDFLTSLAFPMKRAGGLSDHLRGKIITKYLHRKAIEDLLPPEIMKKPKQGGFVPVMIFLKNPEKREKIYRHLLHSETMKGYFRADYLSNLFVNYESTQGKRIYWHNFHNSKANQILFLLTFDIWHHFYVQKNPLECSPPLLNEYLR